METDDSIEEPIGSGVISTADDSIAIIPAEAATIDQPLRILKKKIKKLQFKKTPLSSTEDEDSMANLVEAKARASAMIAPSKEEKMEEEEKVSPPRGYRNGGWSLDSTTPDTPNTVEMEERFGCKFRSRGEISDDASYDSYSSSGVITHRPSGEVIYRPKVGDPSSSPGLRPTLSKSDSIAIIPAEAATTQLNQTQQTSKSFQKLQRRMLQNLLRRRRM